MSEYKKQPNDEYSNTHKTKKQRTKPKFMSMIWLRLHIKSIVWFIIITFIISLFFIGYGTSVEKARHEEKQREVDNLENAQYDKQNALPKSMAGKENEPAVFVSYCPNNASFTAVITAKELWQTIKNAPQFARYEDNPAILAMMFDYLKESAINELISTNLLSLYAKANNMLPSVTANDIISREMSGTTPQEFNRKLRQVGLTMEEYGNRRLLQISAATAYQNSAVQVPVASATEEYLKNYYETHKVNFKKNSLISFEHLLITAKALASDIKVTDEQLKEYYAKNPSAELKEDDIKKIYEERNAEFKTPEQVKASHILIKPRGEGTDEEKFEEAKKVAQGLYEKAINGEDFAKLAKENSEDKSCSDKGGDLGFFSRGLMVQPFEEAVFSANVGSITEPVKTPFGYHVIKVEAKNPETTKTFEEAKSQLIEEATDKIKEVISLQLAEEQLAQYASKLYTDNSSSDIDALVKAYGKDNEGKHNFTDLPFAESPGNAYPELAQGRNIFSNNGTIYNAEFHKQVLGAIKANRLNVYLEPFKTDLGYHIVKVLSYKDNQYDTYEDSRDLIRRMLTFEPSDAELNKYFEDHKSEYDVPATRTTRQILCRDKDTADRVYKELNNGALFANMARTYSEDPSSSPMGGLMSPAVKGRYTPELDDAIWKLNKGEYTQPIETPLGWYIVKLEDETQEVKATLEGSVLAKIKTVLRGTYQDEARTSFVRGLFNQAYVVRNEDILNSVNIDE